MHANTLIILTLVSIIVVILCRFYLNYKKQQSGRTFIQNKKSFALEHFPPTSEAYLEAQYDSDLIWLLRPENTAHFQQEYLNALLTNDNAVNERDLHGVPVIILLMCSNITNKASILAQMLKIGVDIYAMDPQGNTALTYASDEDVLKLLLMHRACIDGQNAEGKTALHLAKSLTHIQLLLNNGADPNIRDCMGKTALHSAKSLTHIQLLLNNGADPNIRDCDGKTPLFYVTKRAEACALTLAGAKIDITDNDGNIAPIVTQGPELPTYAPRPLISDRTEESQLKLTHAIKDGDLQMAESLLIKGVSPTYYFISTSTMEPDKPQPMIALLCRYRAGLDTYMLKNAIENNAYATCQMLIDYGVTPTLDLLEKAIHAHAVKCCQVLLETGIAVNIKTWQIVVNTGMATLIDLFEQYCHFKLTYSDAPTIELKMKLSQNPGMMDDAAKKTLLKQLYLNDTPEANLLEAITKCDTEAVQMLLNAGASPDCKNDIHTALTLACNLDLPKIVKLLCAAGADPSKRNIQLKTPMEYALSQSPASVSILKDYLRIQNCIQSII